jgi:hypothetical protein
VTYIGRYESNTGAYHVRHKLTAARSQLEYSFPDDGRREIPQVLAVFEALNAAIRAARDLEAIFEGNGTQTLADFLPDESGSSVNDRQMKERNERSMGL